MQQSNSYLTEGSIIKTVWSVSWPMVSTYFLQTLVSLVDIKMVGSLGQENIAAVGLATTALMIVMMLMMGLSTGTTALVARYSGEGSNQKVKLVIQQSYLISLVVAGLMTFLGALLATPTIRAMGGDLQVTPIGSGYLKIMSYGSLFLTGNMIVSAIMIGLGRTKANLQILAVINLLNILGNYLLIFGVGPFPELKTNGAALASVVSRGIGFVWGVKLIWSWGYGSQSLGQFFRFNREYSLKILGIGFPVAIDAVSRRLQIAVLNKILSYTIYGTRAISAYTIGIQTEAISFMPGLAFMSAATSLVGHNLGANKPDRAEESGWTSVRFAAVVMSVLGIFLVVFSRQIVGFFTNDQTVIQIGSHYLIVNGIAQPIMAVNMVLSGALRGAGDAVTPLWISALTLWGLRIPLSIVLGLTLGLEADGVWYAMLASIVISTVFFQMRFRKGEWKKIKL
jgi:putative MATE family efflux protein